MGEPRITADAVRHVAKLACISLHADEVTRMQRELDAILGFMAQGEMDYRYFPDPDLPALQVTDATVEAAQRLRPEQLVRDQGLAQVSDEAAIETVVREVLERNPDSVKLYRSGKTNVLGFFVGQVMRAMNGAGNPRLVNELLQRLLREGS